MKRCLFSDEHLLREDQVFRSEEGNIARASGWVPKDLPLFRDHFPDFPVLPGVLTIEILKRVAEYCRFPQGGESRLAEIHAVKFSQFLKPGDRWECEVELLEELPAMTQWKGSLSSGGRRAATAVFSLAANE